MIIYSSQIRMAKDGEDGEILNVCSVFLSHIEQKKGRAPDYFRFLAEI